MIQSENLTKTGRKMDDSIPSTSTQGDSIPKTQTTNARKRHRSTPKSQGVAQQFSALKGPITKTIIDGLTDPNNFSLENVATMINGLKLTTSAVLMRSWRENTDPLHRAAIAHAVISTYCEAPPLTTIMDYAETFGDLSSLFGLLLKSTSGEQLSPEDEGLLYQSEKNNKLPTDEKLLAKLITPKADASVKYDTATGSVSIEESMQTAFNFSGNALDFVQDNIYSVRIIGAVLAIIAAMCGLKGVVEVKCLDTLPKDIIALSGVLSGLKNVWNTATTTLDTILTVVYQFFDKEYISPQHAKVQVISNKVEELYKYTIDFVRRTKLDYFGLQGNDVAQMEIEVEKLNTMYMLCTAEEKSMYNFNNRMATIQSLINELHEMITDMYKSSGGKPRPATIWVAGTPGVGKTEFLKSLATKLIEKEPVKGSIYCRTVLDEFWSGYRNQMVCIMDDLKQSVEGRDIVEFHSYTSSDAKDVIGAGLTDKGRPFTSAYLLTSSNDMWIAPPSKITNYAALNRRRDVVIYADNPRVLEYKMEHNGNEPPRSWWNKPENATHYYVLDPEYGTEHSRMNNLEARRVFAPTEEWVTGKITVDQIVEGMYNLKQMRREAFRSRLLELGELIKYPITTDRIEYDESKFCHRVCTPAGNNGINPNIIVEEQEFFDAESDDSKLSDLDRLPIIMQEETKDMQIDDFANLHKTITGDSLLHKAKTAYAGTFKGFLNVMEEIKVSKSYWIAAKGYLQVCTGRKYTKRGIDMYLSQKTYLKDRFPIVEFNEFDVKVYYFTDELRHQSNPVRHLTKIKTSPAIIFSGPPGTGKSHNIKTALTGIVDWDLDKVGDPPNDKPILLDDITTTPTRLARAKTIIADYHDKQRYSFVIATMNPNTATWQQLPQDDKDMMLRRSHVIKTEYSNYTQLAAFTQRVTPAVYLRPIGDREDYINVEFDLYPGRAKGIYDLKPTLANGIQIAILEVENCHNVNTNDTHIYDQLILPPSKCPDIKVMLDDPHKPNIARSKLLKRKGKEYVPMAYTDYAEVLKMFLPLAGHFSDRTIAHQSLAAKIVNSARIANNTSYKSALIITTEWIIGLETIDGVVVAYLADASKAPTLEVHHDSYSLDGKFYRVEDAFDANSTRMLGRIYGKLEEVERMLGQNWPEPMPTVEQAVEASMPRKVIRNIVSLLDILISVGLGTAALYREKPPTPIVERHIYKYEETIPEADAIQHERREKPDTNRAPEWPPCELCGKPDSPKHKCRGRLDRYEKITPERRDKAPEQTKVEYPPCTLCGKPDSPKHKCKERRDRYECKGDEEVQFKSMSKDDLDSNAMYFAAKGEHHLDCHYGIVFDGAFTYAHELNRSQQWTIFSDDAYSDDVHVLEKAPSTSSRNLINQAKGHHVTYPKDSTKDFGEMFARYIAFNEIADDAQFKREIKRFPKHRDNLSREGARYQTEQFEGSFDPAAKDSTLKLLKSKVAVVDSENNFCQYAIMLKGRIGLVNYHAPRDFKIKIEDKYYDTRVIDAQKDNDILTFIITDVSLNAFPDVISMIPTKTALNTFLSRSLGRGAVMIGLGTTKEAVLTTAAMTSYTGAVTSETEHGAIRYRSSVGCFGYSGVTVAGDCGSPVVLMHGSMQQKFIGIHSRGSADVSVGAPIYRELIEKMIDTDQMKEQSKVQNGMRKHRALEYFDEDMRYHCELTNLNVIGKPAYHVHIPNTTTKYRTGLNVPCNTEPSIKTKRDPRNINKKDMLLEGLSRYGEKRPLDFTYDEVQYAAECIGDYLSAKMVNLGLTTRELTNTEALNGAPKEEFPASKAIDRSGAVGYDISQLCPSRTAKQDYLWQNENDLNWYFRKDEHSQHILSESDLMLADAKKGIAHDVPWVAYPKDEPLDFKKIYDLRNQKCRIFFSGPMSYQLAYRKAFGAALWRITELHNSIPVRVGINPTSLEWQSLAYQHLRISPNGFDSDMKNWDGTVPLAFLQAVPVVYNMIYKRTDANWMPSDDVMRTTLHKPIEGATVVCYDKIFKLDQAMASGYPGTAIENSLINWMLFYCCWRRIMEKKAPQHASFLEFMRHSCLSVYGDDNICSVASVLEPFFNFNTFQAEALKFGFVVTDALKTGGKCPDTKPLGELTFLKRSFDKQGFLYIPTLEEDSIWKTLNWVNSSPPYEYRGDFRTTKDHQVMSDSINALSTEVSLYGKVYYDQWKEILIQSTFGTGIDLQIQRYEEARAKIGI